MFWQEILTAWHLQLVEKILAGKIKQNYQLSPLSSFDVQCHTSLSIVFRSQGSLSIFVRVSLFSILVILKKVGS